MAASSTGIVRGTQVALILLTCFGYYLTWGMVHKNGTVELMRSIRDRGPHMFQGTNEPLRKTYTGFAIIDYQLVVLAVFFWEMVDGSRPGASLLCFHFAGQVGAAYILLQMEGLRPYKRDTVLAYVHVWGLAMQVASFALLAPLYLLIDLFTSPGTASISPEDHLPNAASLLAVPSSILAGYIFPSILMALPAPSIVSRDRKQLLMSIWQVFPLWVGISHQVVARLLAGYISDGQKVRLVAQRAVYLFAVLLAIVTHISTFAVVGVSTLFPDLFVVQYNGAFNFASTFVIDGLMQPAQVRAIGEGAHLFLQNDEFTGVTAMALWAFALVSVSWPEHSWQANLLSFSLIAIGATVITGPVGAAAILLWMRDEKVIKDYAKRAETEVKVR